MSRSLPRGTTVDVPEYENGETRFPLRTPIDAIALTGSEALTLPASQLWRALRTSGKLNQLWLLATTCRFTGYQHRLLDLLSGDVRAQVASLLLHETTEQHTTPLTQQMMANLLGVRRSSISRVLTEFERRGVIETGYGRITIRDWHALQLAADGYAATAA